MSGEIVDAGDDKGVSDDMVAASADAGCDVEVEKLKVCRFGTAVVFETRCSSDGAV